MPCLKCGGESEDALICDACADQCYEEAKFFLNPALVGPSVFSRLRNAGSAAYHLGPVAHSSLVHSRSADMEKAIRDIPAQAVRREDLAAIYQRANAILAHLGVPLKADTPDMLLTLDAANTITAVARKVNAIEQMYPSEAISDLYVRMGIVYWAATKGLLLRTAPKAWRTEKSSYLFARAKEYLLKVRPEDDLYSIACRSLGMVCADAGEWVEAEEHLSEALRHFPNDTRILEALAKAYLALENSVEALVRVDEALAQGENARLWTIKGSVLRDMDRLEDALECFKGAISLDSKFVTAHDLLIETLRDLGRVDEASVAESQRTIAIRPGLEEKVQQLVTELKMATKEGPLEAPPAPRARRPKEAGYPPTPAPAPTPPQEPLEDALVSARRALESKDFDSAVHRARHALREDPDSRDAQLILIESLYERGELREAAPVVHSLYEKRQDDPLAWYWRARVADMEGRWGAAVQYYSKAVTLDKNFVDAWVRMGEVLFANDKVSGADESFSRAIQIDADSPRAWLGKGRAMRKLGRWGAAIQCLDRYNSLAPDDKDAWLLKGEILQEKGKLERALEAFDRYLAIAPDDSRTLGKKGIVLQSLGRVDDARACLEEAVRLDPQNKDAAKWLKSLSSGGGAE